VPLCEATFLLAKNLTTAWMMHIARRPRQAALAAAAIIAGTKQAAAIVEKLWKRSSVVISPVTPPELEQHSPCPRAPNDPLRIIWCGGIEARKALRLLLLSLGRLIESEVRWELLVIGSGPLEGRCRTMANDIGIAEHCRFMGRQSRDKVLNLMRSGHVFVHSSLYDGSPTTVVEAMKLGLPLVGLDHCGFGDAVNERYGILIPPVSIEVAVAGFA
jgi:glycosyltransferase involved in cell wall biosynthesis